MAVTPQQTLQHIRRRQARLRAAADQRAARFRARLPEAVAALRERFGAQQVWIFGSLARDAATPESDIDLAVRGLREGTYFDALAFLMGLFESAVDLVEVEKAGASLRERIETEGKPL